MKNIGNRLQVMRKRQKLSRTQLAEMSGLSPRTIQNYEAGTSKPKIESIEKLAVALGSSARYLMYGVNPTPESYIENRQEVLKTVTEIFESDALSEEDKLAFLTEIQAIYLKAARKSDPKASDESSQ